MKGTISRFRRSGASSILSRSVVAFCVATLVSACGPSKVPRLSTGNTALDPRELTLRAEADKAEKAVRESGFTIDDPALQPWLDSVAVRLLPQFHAVGMTVRVAAVRDPMLNAGVLENGFLFVNSGMLARFENEAQLACVVGHELEHHFGRHSLRKERTANRTDNFVLAGAALSSVPFVGLGLLIAAMASESGGRSAYSRELEREADRAALRAMAGAGYDASQCQRAFEIFQSVEEEAGIRETHKYGDHPLTAERIESYRVQAAEMRKKGQIKDGGRLGIEEYAEATADVMYLNAALDLDISRFYHAQQAINRHLAARPQSAKGHYLKGQILRQFAGRDRGLLASAAESYGRAVVFDPKMADARRELGLAELDLGRTAEARVHLAEYLRLAPKADDRAIVESYLR